jgi:hypothetical protein
MMKRTLALVLGLGLATALPALATASGHGSGGGHPSGGHSSSGHSSGSHSSGSSGKPVHVQGYTRKDGTFVAGYNRATPGTKSSLSITNAEPPKSSASDGLDIHWSKTPESHLTGGFGSESRRSATALRDSHGKIERSKKAKDDFERTHPCPSTGKTSGACPGYVIDHVVALKRGGADDPSNMQWQTVADAKAKDKWE